jgi:hypothetical protein
MVQALLAGQKTQTRRVLKPQPTPAGDGLWHFHNRFGGISQAHEEALTSYIVDAAARYAVGDRLWVRENWAVPGSSPLKYGPIYYAADKHFFMNQRFEVKRKRPSIHMPRWASRLTLIVTGVKVERLNDISGSDARAEGHPIRSDPYLSQEAHDDAARDWFMDLWDSINGAGAWASNPWVVALTFDVVKANIDAMEG